MTTATIAQAVPFHDNYTELILRTCPICLMPMDAHGRHKARISGAAMQPEIVVPAGTIAMAGVEGAL